MSNICFIVRSSVFFDGMPIVWVILHHEYRCCNVEDINIHHITECLSLSFVASFEDWYCLFRTWSFTLCKNDLDFNDISDSASVWESILSFSTMNMSVCCAVQQVSLFHLPSNHQISTLEKSNSCQQSTLSNLMSKRPKQVSLFFDVAHSMRSEVIDFHIWFAPGFLMQ